MYVAGTTSSVSSMTDSLAPRLPVVLIYTTRFSLRIVDALTGVADGPSAVTTLVLQKGANDK